MPRFELETSEQKRTKLRASSPEDAVRRHFDLSNETEVVVDGDEGFDKLSGWRIVHVGGEQVARVRPLERMRFRRD